MAQGPGTNAGDDHRQRSAAPQPEPSPQSVGIDRNAAHQDFGCPAIQR